MWSVGAKTLRGSKKLSLACGLSWRKRCVGQEACRWSVVCRGEIAAWVKKASGVVWSVGRKGRVGQRNHTYRMPQTSQIATQIKIAKTLKT